MQSSRIYQGETTLENEEIKGNRRSKKIQLEYYKVLEGTEKYGVEIVKKEYRNNKNINTEIGTISNISESSKKVINIIETLKKHKVTPIGLQDVVEDLLKQNKF